MFNDNLKLRDRKLGCVMPNENPNFNFVLLSLFLLRLFHSNLKFVFWDHLYQETTVKGNFSPDNICPGNPYLFELKSFYNPLFLGPKNQLDPNFWVI